MAYRFIQPAFDAERVAEIAMGFRQGGVELQRLLESPDGFSDFFLAGQGVAEIVESLGIAGINLHGAAQRFFRCLELVLGAADRTEKAPGLGMRRLCLNYLLIKLFRLIWLNLLR